tara:strand:- start:286 stop:513 length:228 start_codon:yes stop_codon:yes gene_type:complete
MKAKKKQNEVCCFCGTMFEAWVDSKTIQSFFCSHECGSDFASESLANNEIKFINEARVIARKWYKSPENPINNSK